MNLFKRYFDTINNKDLILERFQNSALRHILTTDELPITFLEDLDGSEDLGNMMIDNDPEAELGADDDDGVTDDDDDNDSGKFI